MISEEKARSLYVELENIQRFSDEDMNTIASGENYVDKLNIAVGLMCLGWAKRDLCEFLEMNGATPEEAEDLYDQNFDSFF